MKGFRTILSACLVLALLGGAWAGAEELEQQEQLEQPEQQQEFILGIYTTTDMSGKCYNEDPLFDREIADSYLKVASAMAQERGKNDAALLLDNGGLLQGTSMAWCNRETRSGEESPLALCLRYCGYDAVSLSAREFGFDEALRKNFDAVLSNETGKYPGAPVEALCANELDRDSQESVRTPYVVRSFETFDREYRVGILSFGETEGPEGSRSREYSGITFAHGGNEEGSLAYEWNNVWKKVLLEEEECDYVIVMLPFGRENGQEDPITSFVQSTTGIDMVVAGRDRVPGVWSLTTGDGYVIPVVNGGGSELTKITLRIQNGVGTTVEWNGSLKLSDYGDDEGLRKLMEPYYENTVSFAEEKIGTLTRGWDQDTSHYYATDDTTDLFHEIQLWATGAELSILDPGLLEGVSVARLSRQAGGTPISMKDCWELFPYGDYRLQVIEMTGRQIKDWLEHCAGAYGVDANGAITGGGMGVDQIANLHYDIYLGAPVGARVENITYQDRPVTEQQTFRVAVSSRRLDADETDDPYGWYGITGIGQKGEKVLWNSAESQEFGGEKGSFFSILIAYVEAQEAQGKRVMPTEPRGLWTIAPGNSAEVLAPVTRLELVQRLYQLAGSPQGAAPAPFSDGNNDPAVNWAYAVGISNGDGSGYFRPRETVTREQTMVMLFRYDQARGKVPERDDWQVGVTYVDAAKISLWSGEALMWNEVRSYLTADVENYLHPNESLTMGQMEEVLEKLK